MIGGGRPEGARGATAAGLVAAAAKGLDWGVGGQGANAGAGQPKFEKCVVCGGGAWEEVVEGADVDELNTWGASEPNKEGVVAYPEAPGLVEVWGRKVGDATACAGEVKVEPAGVVVTGNGLPVLLVEAGNRIPTGTRGFDISCLGGGGRSLDAVGVIEEVKKDSRSNKSTDDSSGSSS